jgi:hypothetical protein
MGRLEEILKMLSENAPTTLIDSMVYQPYVVTEYRVIFRCRFCDAEKGRGHSDQCPLHDYPAPSSFRTSEG